MFTPLRFSSGAWLVAGALLVPRVALAQATPAITPANGTLTSPLATPSDALFPTSVASAPVASASPAKARIDTLTFKDVNVSELLSMISGEFGVNIVVSGDVSGKLSSINLSNVTAEQAIALVVRAAGLQSQRDADGTFIIGKSITPDAPRQAITPSLPQNLTALPTLNPGTGSGFGSGIAPTVPNSPALNDWTGNNDEFGMVPSRGDDVTLVQPSQQAQKNDYRIKINNVRASLLAYWLDPAHQPEPEEVKMSHFVETKYYRDPVQVKEINLSTSTNSASGNVSGLTTSGFANPYLSDGPIETRSNAQFGRGGNNGNNNNGRGGANGGGVFQLPQGVDQIVAVDPQNALLVSGTPEGVAELRRTILFLDRPLRQVEIEAQFLTVSTSAASAFGVDFTTARGNFNANTTGFASQPTGGSFSVGFVRGNFQAALNALKTDNRTKVLSAPRVTAINNLTASLVQTSTVPIQLTTAIATSNSNNTNTVSGQNIFLISTSISLTVTPTINNDGTVTVRMQPQFTSQTPGGQSVSGAPTIASSFIDTIANVRDGETIALGGLKTKNIAVGRSRVPVIGDLPILGKLFTSRTNSEVESELIIFLTARILHRQGDEVVVPGT